MAGASLPHSIVTGAPVFTTTTVFGLAATTRLTSASWSPGQVHRLAVVALRLPVVVGAHEEDHRVGRRRRGDCPIEQIVGRRQAAADLDAPD